MRHVRHVGHVGHEIREEKVSIGVPLYAGGGEKHG